MNSAAPPVIENDDVRARWETNAAYWDERMGEGNLFHLQLVEPSALALLEIERGQRVLELACGNGQFARKMTALGAHVLATDFSAAMVERARAHTEPFNDQIEYRVLDATDETALRALGTHEFDAVVANMALMDMSEIAPLFNALPQLLRPRGRFVFTIQHPCFNNNGMRMSIEEEDRNGELVQTRAFKLTRYLHATPVMGQAIAGQPVLQYYFDRPLHVYFGAAARAGLVVDGLLEPGFPESESRPNWASWVNFHEFPPVLALRLRVAAFA